MAVDTGKIFNKISCHRFYNVVNVIVLTERRGEMKGWNNQQGLNVMLFSDFKADIQYKLTHNRKKELIF